MTSEEMQSTIAALVRKVEKGSGGAGPDAAIHAILGGLARYVSEYEADLVDQQFRDETFGDAGEPVTDEEIRLWSHMYGVLDSAGLKLRSVPARKKKKRVSKAAAALASAKGKAARSAAGRALAKSPGAVKGRAERAAERRRMAARRKAAKKKNPGQSALRRAMRGT